MSFAAAAGAARVRPQPAGRGKVAIVADAGLARRSRSRGRKIDERYTAILEIMRHGHSPRLFLVVTVRLIIGESAAATTCKQHREIV